MKIGVFGGTFNPPHKGHTRLAAEFSEKLGLDRVLIINFITLSTLFSYFLPLVF